MKLTFIVMVVSFFFMMIPLPAPQIYSQSLPAEIWEVDEMQAWGDKDIAIDFGITGVWNYNGSWIRLSRLDSQKMEFWGGHKLAVDFGSYRLWIYDGHTWERIA